MKTLRPIFLAAAAIVLLAGSGCANASLDLAAESDPNRVVTGTVNYRSEQPLPPDAEIVVRVIDTASVEQTRTAANRDLPVATRPQSPLPPTVLGEQTIKSPGEAPVPFRVEFTASDALLLHGLNIDVRISAGGRVRFRTVNAHVVTLSSVGTGHEVWVAAVGR